MSTIITGGDGVFTVNGFPYKTSDYRITSSVSNVTILPIDDVNKNYIIHRVPISEIVDERGNSYGTVKKLLDAFASWTDTLKDFNDAQLDAGGRLRVSQMTTLLDIKQINDNQPLYYDRESIGGAAQVYVKNKGGVEMSVAANNDAAIVQSKMWANYFSGKSQLGKITFSGMTNQSNVIKRAGYFSSNIVTPFDSNKDGLWFEADGNDYRFRIQKNGVDILNVAQSDWNLDTFDTFDGSKFNVFVFQFLYLGGTSVMFGFFRNGKVNWAHEYVHAGVVESTFVESPNQPLRYEIRSIGGSGTFDQICAKVASEGSVDNIGVNSSFDVENFQANSAGTIYAVVGIRQKQTYRNITIKQGSLRLLTQKNDDCIWRVSLNPVVSGTFTYVDEPNSALQVAKGVTANQISNTGKVIATGFSQGNNDISDQVENALRIGSTIAGVMDELVLSVQPLTNGLDVYVSGQVQEFL